MDIGSMTESEALDLFHAMRRRFGWQGVVLASCHVEEAWSTLSGEDVDTLSDRQWSAIWVRSDWQKIGDRLESDASDLLRDSVFQAMRFLAETDGK